MGFFDLPTLAEVQADRASRPNWKTTRTILDEKTEADKDDARKLEAWKSAVRKRDKGRCRVCEVKTVKTLEADPKRGEAHHIKTRADKRVRYDLRNGLHVCLKCHQRLEGRGKKLHVIGTAAQMFTVDGKTYLNGDKRLRFTESKEA